MKKWSLLSSILFLSMIQANPSGYIIFDYENTMGHDFFDIKNKAFRIDRWGINGR